MGILWMGKKAGFCGHAILMCLILSDLRRKQGWGWLVLGCKNMSREKSWWGRECILMFNLLVSRRCPVKALLRYCCWKRDLKGGENTGHAGVWERSVPGRGRATKVLRWEYVWRVQETSREEEHSDEGQGVVGGRLGPPLQRITGRLLVLCGGRGGASEGDKWMGNLTSLTF